MADPAHDPLPEYKPGFSRAEWRKYHISTPTLSLTPVEKPDTSPYLIHMTGKAEIASILRGKEGASPAPADHGFLRASIPSQSKGNYFASVVCFTESPTFAIDFFRYRSWPRFEKNMMFGIGFAKGAMAARGVFPALYLSANDKDQLVKLYGEIVGTTPPPEGLEARLRKFLESVYPLCTPLGEDEGYYQGFYWEREWRFRDPAGLAFAHSDIRLICCPDGERAEISAVLGNHAKNVRFVRTWAEFSEVTDFMDRQHRKWAQRTADAKGGDVIAGAKADLLGKTAALNSLEAYTRKLQQAQDELTRAAAAKAQLESEIASLKKQIGQPEKVSINVFSDEILNHATFILRFESVIDAILYGKLGKFPSADGQTEGRITFSRCELKVLNSTDGGPLYRQGEFKVIADVLYEGLLHDGSDASANKNGAVTGLFEVSFDCDSYDDVETAAEAATIKILKIYERP